MQNLSDKCSKTRAIKSGFTLIEMLIVVLIIGILAAIALLQYRMSVVKSKFSSIKTMTQELVSAGERYYLATGNRPSKFSDLDISFNDITGLDTGTITFSNGDICYLYGGQYDLNTQQCIACEINVSNTKVRLYKHFSWKKRTDWCLVSSTNEDDIYNKFCQQETGRKIPSASGPTYFMYYYL